MLIIVFGSWIETVENLAEEDAYRLVLADSGNGSSLIGKSVVSGSEPFAYGINEFESTDSHGQAAADIEELPLIKISLADLFQLGEDAISTNVDLFGNMADYIRAPSFFQYIIETYGIERVKQWVRQVNDDNFYSSLSIMAGRSISLIQSDWKRSVLDKMNTKNNEIRHWIEQDREHNFGDTTEEIEERLGRIKVLLERRAEVDPYTD